MNKPILGIGPEAEAGIRQLVADAVAGVESETPEPVTPTADAITIGTLGEAIVGAVVDTDTVADAIAKLEARIAALETPG